MEEILIRGRKKKRERKIIFLIGEHLSGIDGIYSTGSCEFSNRSENLPGIMLPA